jgi:hypothetical protein
LRSLRKAGAPLLMAVINPDWPYWDAAFPAQLDVLWIVGMLVVSEAFPEDTQAFAGGIFNTVAQLGNSLGLAVMGVISTSVTQHSHFRAKAVVASMDGRVPSQLLGGFCLEGSGLLHWRMGTEEDREVRRLRLTSLTAEIFTPNADRG